MIGIKGRKKVQGGEMVNMGDVHEVNGERIWDRYTHLEGRKEPNRMASVV